VDYHQLLVEHLPLVDRIVRLVARRHRLTAADTDELGSIVRFKLVDGDFAILRKFEGRSALSTYLTVVIERLCLDFCTAKFGKWRPSVSAVRLGAVATLLEQLVMREGITFEEAVGTLQTNHGVGASREELHDMFVQLRPRQPSGARREQELDQHILSTRSSTPAEDDEVVARVEAALGEVIAQLSQEEKAILSLRFESGLPVPQIARSLGLELRPLYRRLHAILSFLRKEMARHDVDPQDIARAACHPALSLHRVLWSVARRS
jgi:RNA polymerase sigma factor (sigma-70 family)